jgi:maleate cis-trans isomerase
MDSALFIQKQNELNIEIEETKKKRNGFLDSNGFEKEIEGTIRLLEIIKYNPEIMDSYHESLLTHTVDQVIIGQNKTITFKLINGLKLTEHISKGGEDA